MYDSWMIRDLDEVRNRLEIAAEENKEITGGGKFLENYSNDAKVSVEGKTVAYSGPEEFLYSVLEEMERSGIIESSDSYPEHPYGVTD